MMLLDLEQFKSHWATTFPGITTHNTHFIIAVSGGVDSVVLAVLMQQMGANCSIAHANFQLRGDESNRDESFVQVFATKMGMPFSTHWLLQNNIKWVSNKLLEKYAMLGLKV